MRYVADISFVFENVEGPAPENQDGNRTFDNVEADDITQAHTKALTLLYGDEPHLITITGIKITPYVWPNENV